MKFSQKNKAQNTQEKSVAMPLGRINYILILIGSGLIAASFAMMYLERSVDGVFALFISPVLLIAAYVGIAFAILYRPKQKG